MMRIREDNEITSDKPNGLLERIIKKEFVLCKAAIIQKYYERESLFKTIRIAQVSSVMAPGCLVIEICNLFILVWVLF